MINVDNKKYSDKKVVDNLRNDYIKALKDDSFKNLVNKLKIKENIALKYTSSLQDSAQELTNCSACKSLLECKNKLEGYVYYPTLKNDKLSFSYIACKYKKKQKSDELEKENNSELKNASFKTIDITDKKRVKIIKWLKDFYDKYDKNKKIKGLYLHGSFGSGKTYLMAAMLNELAKKRVTIEISYFPELIRDLKNDFDSYGEKIDYYQNVDILLLDDIGAEKVTEWSRDEVLGTILQKRMEENKVTFFTSNLNLEELESHLTGNYGSDNLIKARRIIQRIKYLTDVLELVSENRRD